MIASLGEAPDNSHLERVRDEGSAESAEVGVGHVVGHCQHAHLRLPAFLQSNIAHRKRQLWTSGQNPIHRNSNPKTLEVVAHWEVGRGRCGGWVGVEEDDAAGLLDAGVSRGEVD